MNAKRLENFARSVETLRGFIETPVKDQRDLAGIAFGFNQAFDLAWKCLQDKIQELGYTERGPKLTLSAAFQAALIPSSEEAVWSEMLQDRNLAAHIYNQALGEELVERVRHTHCAVLEALVVRLRT